MKNITYYVFLAVFFTAVVSTTYVAYYTLEIIDVQASE